jgi:hypothetical protein
MIDDASVAFNQIFDLYGTPTPDSSSVGQQLNPDCIGEFPLRDRSRAQVSVER